MLARTEQSELRELRERVTAIEKALGLRGTHVPMKRSMGPQVRAMLKLLLLRDYVGRDTIELVLAGDREVGRDYAKDRILMTRRFLQPYGISVYNHYGKGWFLTAADKIRLRDELGMTP